MDTANLLDSVCQRLHERFPAAVAQWNPVEGDEDGVEFEVGVLGVTADDYPTYRSFIHVLRRELLYPHGVEAVFIYYDAGDRDAFDRQYPDAVQSDGTHTQVA